MNIPATWAEAAESLRQMSTLTSLASSHCEHWLSKFLTADPVLVKIKDTIRILSAHPLVNTILITGPSGHGKELLAKACIYNVSSPFIPVNCAALPDTLLPSLLFGHVKGTFTGATEDREGVFEAAKNGTVFLDEVGEMPTHQQASLLRIIQEREVVRLGSSTITPISCRIIAATNAPENLRHDLFGRLMGVHLDIPPLINRPDDLRLICKTLNIDPDFSTPHFVSGISLYGVRYLQALQQRQMIGL